MERTLQDRDRVGVEDFVLLEDYTNIDAFLDNLRKRHRENLIYTSIGHVLISVNPYKSLPIYGDDVIKEYRKTGFNSAPHVYAIAENAYRSLTEENIGQCILISGESGAGKTEASKKVLQYVAAAANNEDRVVAVKDKLLLSNPVLEAFGNAKTNKNDNSSRFGKYMDIAFDFKGAPAGGNILNYLLEKSRIVYQTPGERNFHIFYQVLAGSSEEQLRKLQLVRDTSSYAYLKNNNLQSENDVPQFHEVRRALSTMEFSEIEQNHLFDIIASILHLGNVEFEENEAGFATIPNLEPIRCISELLGCDPDALKLSLTQRTIEARGEVVSTPLDIELALYARDALAKAVYDRLFTWLVKRINSSLATPRSDTAVIGILDIYGFEVFQKNSFEQFCINFCNEKLQQLFIKLTLKHEQDEYRKEGIEWIQVEFFDNKIICDMIEERHKGIIAMMDEECLRPGNPSDMSLLSKMNKQFKTHRHYVSHDKTDIKTQKTMGRNEFIIAHYAGDVTYCVDSFLDKNSDLLFRDLCDVMNKTSNSITQTVFTQEELKTKKRPDTAITKFHRSLNELTLILSNKDPSYIRCIRPNDTKSPSHFDEPVVHHQVTYLGLMENLRVRRAGFAYRRPYDEFLHRFKCLSKNTWPNYRGSAKQGVQVLVNDLGYTSEEYRMGTTKLFIRSPNTLFKTEDAFQEHKHFIAAIIQKMWKGRKQRQAFLKLREAAISIERIVRGFLARREAERRRKAVNVIRRFVIGFITRNGPETDINQKFVRIAKVQWLKRLAKSLPKSLLDKSWPKCPTVCEEASGLLHRMHTLQLARKYRNKLSPSQKYNFELKVMAKDLFEGKKETYPKSFGKWFLNDRILGSDQTDLLESFIKTDLREEKLVYSSSVSKLDRHGYKDRRRVLLITNKFLYLFDPKTGKQKHRLPHNAVTELTITAGLNDLLIVGIPSELKKDKGDLILIVPHLIETVTTFIYQTKQLSLLKIAPEGAIHHNVINGKAGTIHILKGPLAKHEKNKGGDLVVKG